MGSAMRLIPPEKANAFLTFLNDWVQDRPNYAVLFEDRAPSKIQLEHSEANGVYTVIDFKDKLTLIIPDVYTQFEEFLKSPPSTA